MSAIGVNPSLKSHVSRAHPNMALKGFAWYVYTPQKDHIWAPDWQTAMTAANQAAREAQTEALR